MKLPLPDNFEHGNSSYRTTLIVTSITFTLLGTLTVVARFYIRAIVIKSVGKDDYSIFAAWVSFSEFASILYTAASAAGIIYGVGQSSTNGNNYSVSKAIEATFFVEIFYYFALYLVKASILLFYLRIVDTLRGKFYICTLVCLGILSVHFFSTIVVVFLQCRPISFYWNQNQPGSCLDITSFFYSTNGFTIASDLIILGLPLPVLLKIKRSWKDKLALIIVFGAGAISTVASCIRLYTIKLYTRSHNPLNDSAPINTWSFIELNIGIACASGPSLKALYKHVTRKTENKSQNSNTDNIKKPSPPRFSIIWWRHMNETTLASDASESVVRSNNLEQSSQKDGQETKTSVGRIKPIYLGPFLTNRTDIEGWSKEKVGRELKSIYFQ